MPVGYRNSLTSMYTNPVVPCYKLQKLHSLLLKHALAGRILIKSYLYLSSIFAITVIVLYFSLDYLSFSTYCYSTHTILNCKGIIQLDFKKCRGQTTVQFYFFQCNKNMKKKEILINKCLQVIQKTSYDIRQSMKNILSKHRGQNNVLLSRCLNF